MVLTTHKHKWSPGPFLNHHFVYIRTHRARFLLFKMGMMKMVPLLIMALLGSCSSLATAPRLAREIKELVDPKPEPVLRVRSARVVLADYPLLRRDFPKLQSFSEAEIDVWLLDRTAFVSTAQAAQEKVNTKIDIMNGSARVEHAQGFRPDGYGRALVFRTEEGLIDAKGVGKVNNPEPLNHKNGLATLGEMIREFIFQKKVQQVFDHSGSGFHTVESYAVIDWGFDVREYNGRLIPAGAILRQAHGRPNTEKSQNHFASLVDSTIVENLLRHYGITSTGDAPTETQERVNIQNTREGDIVDFGSYLVKDRFHKQVIHYGTSDVLSDPSFPSFVQPDPRLRLPIQIWGASETGKENPRYDNLWVWSHRLAEDLKAGKAQRHDVSRHFQDMMNGGPLPSELQGLFRDQRSPIYRESVAKDLLINSKFISVRVLDEFLNLNSKMLDGSFFINQITPERLTDVDPQDMLWVLNKHHILEKYPELWTALVRNFKEKSQETPFFLDEMMKAKQGSLIEMAIKNFKFSAKSLEEFLSSEAAQRDKRWPKWVSSAIIKKADFGLSFLKKEVRTAKYTHLFLELANHPSGMSASEMGEVLKAPHWKNHPQYSEWQKQFPARSCELLF